MTQIQAVKVSKTGGCQSKSSLQKLFMEMRILKLSVPKLLLEGFMKLQTFRCSQVILSQEVKFDWLSEAKNQASEDAETDSKIIHVENVNFSD